MEKFTLGGPHTFVLRGGMVSIHNPARKIAEPVGEKPVGEKTGRMRHVESFEFKSKRKKAKRIANAKISKTAT